MVTSSWSYGLVELAISKALLGKFVLVVDVVRFIHTIKLSCTATEQGDAYYWYDKRVFLHFYSFERAKLVIFLHISK